MPPIIRVARSVLMPAAALLGGVAASGAAQEVYGPIASESDQRRSEAPIAIPAPLDRAAAIAAATHPAVDVADAEVRALKAEYRGARWLRYPNLSLEGLVATRGSTFADRDGITANISLEQPVWTGGRIDGEIDRARAGLAAGGDRVNEAERQIVLDVTQAYYEYVLATQRLAVLTDSLAQHDLLLASIERRVRGEVSPQVDLTLGRARTAQVQLDRAKAEELQLSAGLRLNELTGGIEVQPEMPLPGLADTLPDPEIALEEVLRCDPKLAALTNLVAVAEAERRIAKGNLLPDVLLQLSQNEITGARAAVVLRAQTGNGLSQFARIDSAEARIERAVAEFGQAERSLRGQLRREYILIGAATTRLESGTLAADASAEIIASYQRQFIAGRRSWLDVMNAVRESALARLSENEARVSLALGGARILALTCRWQPEPIGKGS